MAIPRVLHPFTNPTGYAAAAGAIYAVVVMIYNAHEHHGAISAPVIVAAVAAVTALLTHQVVTPVSDPKDGAGNRLVPVPANAPAAAAPPGTGIRPVRLVPPEGGGPPVPRSGDAS